MAKSAESLEELDSGDLIHHDDWNALVRSAKRGEDFEEGVGDDSGVARRSKRTTESEWFHVKAVAAVDIDEWSVFGITTGETWTDPCKCAIEDPGDSSLVLLTNGDVKIPAMCTGNARSIGLNRPFKARYTGTAPVIDTECGPTVASGKAIHADGLGMVCLSEPDPTETWVWAMRVASTTMRRELGVLTATLLPGSNASVDLLLWDGSAYSGETIDLVDTLLNSDEQIDVGTRVKVELKEGIWTWYVARCRPADNLP